MEKGRLEAFSDGVIAVIITIMVLEFKVPQGQDLNALLTIAPRFLVYVLSFVNVGIYWNNHHHLVSAASKIDGRVMWANLHLLFWLSLVPFCTNWVGENHLASVPTALYGAVLLFSALAFVGLQATLTSLPANAELAATLGSDVKGKTSAIAYIAATVFAFVNPWISDVLFVAVAALWFVPERRIEQRAIARDA